MDVQVITKGDAAYPVVALQMNQPPDRLYIRGNLANVMSRRRVGIVGSRLISAYGRQVTAMLARELAEQGIAIVSGLALGVDAQAHQSVLQAGGICLAVLPTPVTDVRPNANRRLGEAIIAGGGALISQYPPESESHKGNFVARNELVAAMSEVVVITEAASNSGSLHTANFAADMQTEVRAVPGNITSPTSVGANSLIRAGKAGAITCTQDILHALGIYNSASTRRQPKGETPEQQQLLNLIASDIHDGEALLQTSKQSIATFNQALTMLEIGGHIIPLGANRWGLP